ncbi:MAG: hypothetical protein ACR2P3_03655 [Geminicoccaceae bacterium]
MPENIHGNAKTTLSLLAQAAALLGAFLFAEPVFAEPESLADYGRRFCAEAGIPASQCTLLPPNNGGSGPAAKAAQIKGAKTETLIEHGRRLCAQQGVPLERCKALPSEFRVTERDSLPASAFLTIVDRPLEPAQLAARKRQVRHVRQPPRRPAPPAKPIIRYVKQPPPAYQQVRPVHKKEQPVRYRRRPADHCAPMGCSSPKWVSRPVEPVERCLRSISYSRPPSYRYVARCN